MSENLNIDLDTELIKEWRSIVTLVVFVLANLVVLFPFHVPVYIPKSLHDIFVDALVALRIIPPREHDDNNGKVKPFVRLRFPINFITGPLIADLFLLAILAIGRREVHDGIVGANNIAPLDIMIFFIALAYIAISIDASGLIRYLAFKVLQKGGKVGHLLFFYLYAFFFCLGGFIGNDPIILSGTPFLAYMTRVSRNIVHPRAWIHTQFAVANIASAILVSSNPTNLVLAGAFRVKFIDYTANMVVPVVITAIILFPLLLYFIFANEALIPRSIEMHELPEETRARKPVNPNIPHARGNAEEEERKLENNEQGKLLSLEEIMNPFLDKKGAAFGSVIMVATLVTLLAINAAAQHDDEIPVAYVAAPAAVVMFIWDIVFGWHHRHETREIARKGREEVEQARAERAMREEEERRAALEKEGSDHITTSEASPRNYHTSETREQNDLDSNNKKRADTGLFLTDSAQVVSEMAFHGDMKEKQSSHDREIDSENNVLGKSEYRAEAARPTLVSLMGKYHIWLQETFPTATAVMTHLPFALVPFAFCMFILVQALVTKGWVPVFAYGWDHWVQKTGTIGSIGGMGFLSVVLCNFAGTNVGTTILLSRVIQAWQQIHYNRGTMITDRTFWGAVYSMALGTNYGAFSAAFSASLAGLLWRDILARKHIHVRGLEFLRVNFPIVMFSMVIGCSVLVGEVYIMRHESPYSL
ncbi:hypothetical protein F5X96DRAFT_661082 [Biscogniauxia mediterranea]|nr:hypothetical protein F5X96DRAFT_661082 [Biscogniauxia mediterranea]